MSLKSIECLQQDVLLLLSWLSLPAHRSMKPLVWDFSKKKFWISVHLGSFSCKSVKICEIFVLLLFLFFLSSVPGLGAFVHLEYGKMFQHFTTAPLATSALRPSKCPGGIFGDVARAVNPTTLSHKCYNTTNRSANPAINTLYRGMLRHWYMNYRTITFVTASWPFLFLERPNRAQWPQLLLVFGAALRWVFDPPIP